MTTWPRDPKCPPQRPQTFAGVTMACMSPNPDFHVLCGGCTECPCHTSTEYRIQTEPPYAVEWR